MNVSVAIPAEELTASRLKTTNLLLCAEDKRTQTADIQRAKEYRADYERRKK